MTILIEHLFEYNYLIKFNRSHIQLFTALFIISSLLPRNLCVKLDISPFIQIDINISPILYLLEGTGPASPNTARPTEELYFFIDATAKSSVSSAQSSLGLSFNSSFYIKLYNSFISDLEKGLASTLSII